MALAFRRYRKTLLASGLIDEAELRAFERALPRPQRPTTPAALAQALIDAEKLTPFQAAEVAAGRAAGLVLGNYVLLDRIGVGGMGQVFKAWHRRMHRTVALKTLPNEAAAGENSVARFRREILSAAQLSHPNIVTAFDADVAAGTHFLVMEYVAGQNLAEVLRQRGPLPIAQAVHYVLDAARGLAYAHSQGIVHRDVKPSNLILSPDDVVKLLDLGLARPAAGLVGSELTLPGDVVGTLEYMAPEQAAALETVDGRADIYGLGCTLYRLVTGELPYRGNSPWALMAAHRDEPIPSLRALREDAPRKLDAVFARMVAKQPADRWQTMDEVIEALRRQKPPRATGRLGGSHSAKIATDKAAADKSDKQSDSGISLPPCPVTASPPPTPLPIPPSTLLPTPPLTRASTAPATALAALLAALAGISLLAWLDADRPAQDVPTAAPAKHESAAAWQRHWAKSLGLPVMLTNSLGMRFVLIPPDDMNAAGKVDTPFYCAVAEVTVAEYRQFLTAMGSALGSGAGAAAWQGDRHPAIEMTAADAEMFCRWLSRHDGASYRLPTAMELAHACRAGGGDRLWFDPQRIAAGRFAWYDATSARRTHQVVLLEANPLGLHDILGNAPEWCRATAAGLSAAPAEAYLLFGGSWSSGADDLGTVERGGKFGGLRLVLELPLEARRPDTARGPQ
ncbi:MAG TPA: bifunctional serine/threonine-protein kinase/formylglycine-generating enzyme family protein [Pirellulales bacterium]